MIDLIGRPGATCQPDSFLNSASSMLVASPLCHPKFKPVETAEYTKTLAQLYFLDSQALHLVFDTTSGYYLCARCFLKYIYIYIYDGTSLVKNKSYLSLY